MTHISEEGALDRAARLKREAEAKTAATIGSLQLHRAIAVTLFLVAGLAAGYFYMANTTLAKNVRTATSAYETVDAELKTVKVTADKAVTSAKAAYSELAAKVSEERVAFEGKITALVDQVKSLKDEKVALLAKVDALKDNAAPAVTVFGANATANASATAVAKAEVAAPVVAQALKADKDALVLLEGWSRSLDSYSRAEGPGPGACSVYKRFRDWAKSNHALLADRANAKGWSNDPAVRQSLRRLAAPAEGVDFKRSVIDGYRKMPINDAMAKANKAQNVKTFSGWFDDAYADIQVCGYIMSAASTVGTVKKCNQ